ncbi:NAD(P)-linked oxidoreductase superfamily protein [Forsythia ovata]|uniref:NAD(P)-linked oxidoreductase superfamily protein n=1 Tax=Forsythia ovata TaxID=205694 RepID=A0ABD1TB34_9LAMI
MAQATFTPHDEKVVGFRLLSGHTIPAVGLGTWKSGSPRDSVFTAIVEVINSSNLQISKGFSALYYKNDSLFRRKNVKSERINLRGSVFKRVSRYVSMVKLG